MTGFLKKTTGVHGWRCLKERCSDWQSVAAACSLLAVCTLHIQLKPPVNVLSISVRSRSLSPSLSPSHSDRSRTDEAAQAAVRGARREIKWADKHARETNYRTKNNVVTGTLQPPPPSSGRQLELRLKLVRVFCRHVATVNTPATVILHAGQRGNGGFCNKVNFIIAAAGSSVWGCRLIPRSFPPICTIARDFVGSEQCVYVLLGWLHKT